MESALRRSRAKRWYFTDGKLDLFRGYEACAFELPWRIFVAWAAEEVMPVEINAHVIPATVASVIIDHPIGSGEFVQRVGESAYQHHRRSGRPGEPGKSTR
jgi:hypothetical protein